MMMANETHVDVDVGEGGSAEESAGLSCDFCGERVSRVRRIALDRDYERLQTPHAVRYACSTCSEEKERSRVGS